MDLMTRYHMPDALDIAVARQVLGDAPVARRGRDERYDYIIVTVFVLCMSAALAAICLSQSTTIDPMSALYWN